MPGYKEHFKYCSDMIALRQKLAPHILELARHSANSGEPVIRHMEYVFPGCNYEKINDQFMLGDDILVLPLWKKAPGADLLYFRPEYGLVTTEVP